MVVFVETLDTEIENKKLIKRESGLWRAEGYTINDKAIGLWKTHIFKTGVNQEVIYII